MKIRVLKTTYNLPYVIQHNEEKNFENYINLPYVIQLMKKNFEAINKIEIQLFDKK